MSNYPYSYVGIGYKPQYFAFIQHTDNIGWLEIHAENYMIQGGPRKAMMRELADRFPISCHGVGLSIGSENGLDAAHLERLKSLMEWLKPCKFSEHLSWSTHHQSYFNDLLPLPYTANVLDRVSRHIDQVQEALGRKMLLENPSSYFAFSFSTMSETEFLRKVQERTGCGLLLDVNNVFVSCQNLDMNPYDYIDEFPTDYVEEIHLGGHEPDFDDNGHPLLIDAHNNPVTDAVWTLYEYSLRQTGPVETLIEWDNDLPEWSVLEAEAKKAAAYLKTKTLSHAS